MLILRKMLSLLMEDRAVKKGKKSEIAKDFSTESALNRTECDPGI